MKRLRTNLGLVALLVFALLLGACGGSDEKSDSASEGSTDTAQTTTITADKFAGAVCGALSSWLTDIQDRAASLTPDATDAAATQATLVDFLDGLVTSTDEMITKIESAGVPDTDGGQEAQSAVLDSLENVKTLFEESRDKVAGLSTDDPKAFGQALQSIGTDLQDAADGATSSLDSITDSDINAAFGTNPACASLSGMASPTG
jgi:hypothetical protein